MTNEDPSGKWLHRMEERLIGDSLAMRKLRESIRLAAQGQQPVLIVGETGTGKELVARTLRQQSCPSGRMAYLNALEFPRGFFELRLFGGEPRSYSGQAYTGAMKDAEGGLLYLDEVTHIDSAGQACLSRVLEEGEYRPLNSTKTEKVTARLVASTVCRPKEAVDRGLLLPDIYRYLSALIIEVPPVRERRGDIPPLADYLLTRASMELNRTRPEIDCETMAWLCTYTWPGNVRELRNVVRRAALLADTVVEVHHLAFSDGPAPAGLDGLRPNEPIEGDLPLKEAVRRVAERAERRIITVILRQTGGNKAQAARILQIDYKTVCKKIRDYGICQA